MATLRVAKRERFTVVNRSTVNDDNLSFRARGILVWLLDKPDDWTCNSETLAAQGKEGRDAIRTALAELEEHGYLERNKRQDDKGQWSTEWVIHETPDAGKPVAGSPVLGKPGPITEDCKPNTETERTPPTPQGGSALATLDPAFEDLWRRFPRKVGKPAARRAFKAAAKNARLADIDDGLARWVRFWREDGTAERHIPHPSTWLNQERWNDHPPKPTPKKAAAMDVIARAAERHA